MSRPIAVDLFAGAGGLSLGFEQAGFDVVAAIEYDPVHCATHAFNFPETAVVCADIATLTGGDIREAAGIGDASIDAVFGGPPCQGFSFIGKRLVDDPRNALVGHFIRIVGELRPKYFVLENVPGLASGQHKEILLEALRELEEVGYDVVLPYRILNSSDFGVPQKRRRLFLIGSRPDVSAASYPEPTTPDPALRVTVGDALSDLPQIELYDELLLSDSVDAAAYSEPTAYAATLRGMVDDPHDYAYRRRPSSPNSLTSSMRTHHTALSVDRFERTCPGTVEPTSRFLRLDPDGLCNTLRAGTGAERGAYTSPRPIHPSRPRCITVREAARLHSYPDWFRFHATKWHGFRQVGNSVPPLLARSVARELVRAIGSFPQKPVRDLDLGDPEMLRWSMTQAAAHFGVAISHSRVRRSSADDRRAIGQRQRIRCDR